MITPLPFVSINGKIFSQEKAYIPALNNGVLFGEGVFTTLKVKEGIPLFLESHTRRLLSNMEQLHFPQRIFNFSLDAAVQKLIAKNGKAACAVRITVLRGAEQPFVVMHSRDLPQASSNGVRVITVPDSRDGFKTAKTINRLFLTQAHAQAEKHGAADALLTLQNEIIESTISNVFSVDKDGVIVTPPLEGKGLKGIAREVIMEQLPVVEKEISAKATDPLILVNSLRVQKVLSIDGKSIADGGKLFQKVQAIVEKAEDEYVRS